PRRVLPFSSRWLGRSGGENAGHDSEAGYAADAIGPTAQRRVILPGNAAFLGEHHIGEAGDVGRCRMGRGTEPVAPGLFAEPEMLIHDAEDAVRALLGLFDIEIIAVAKR